MKSPKKSALFSPLTLRGVTFKNRIGVSPMSMCSSNDGFANDFHLVHAGSFATGGAGLVIIEAAAVEEIGKRTPDCLGIWKDEHVEMLARISKFIKSQGAVPAMQLSHSGRKGSSIPPSKGHGFITNEDGGWTPIGPSAVAFGGADGKVPKEATLEDINHIKNAFVMGAKRAIKAGFDMIELHFAHGYLVSSFLSPVSNFRTDKYGGSIDNRMRLALEIVEDVRRTIPKTTVLSVRISVTDYCKDGWDIDDSIELAKKLKVLEVDLLDCSSGGISHKTTFNGDDPASVQIKAAKRVQQEAGIPTCAVGMIKDPLKAEEIIKENGATIVLLGRTFLNNPHWPFYAADLLADEESFKYPEQCDWCIGWKAFGKWRKLLQHNSREN